LLRKKAASARVNISAGRTVERGIRIKDPCAKKISRVLPFTQETSNQAIVASSRNSEGSTLFGQGAVATQPAVNRERLFRGAAKHRMGKRPHSEENRRNVANFSKRACRGEVSR